MKKYIVLTTHGTLFTIYKFKCLICGYITEKKIFIFEYKTEEIENHIKLAHKK
jgi:hypothetical protein